MDIRVLEYFLAVAREESITKAAKALSMTQPPLSRQLKELEDELGKQLFIRGNKKVTLTEEGILLRKRAEELIELMEKTKEEIRSSEERIHGTVLIGAGESDAVSFLARTARRLQMSHPDISYHLYSGDATSITEKLDHGLIDFGLLVEPVDISKYEYLRLPVKDTWGVLMRRDSPLAQQNTVSPRDLWDKPLILSRQVDNKSGLYRWLRKEPSELRTVATYNLIYNASLMVDEGMGYAFTLDKLVNTTGSQLCFRPLHPKLELGMYLVWKKSQIFSKAAELFLEYLQKHLTQLYGELG